MFLQLRTLVLLNMGSILDLPSVDWFGDFDNKPTIHVIDSLRPQNLSSLFDVGDEARVVVWDDGGADSLSAVGEAYTQLLVIANLLSNSVA